MQPLADLLRPQTLKDFIGQEHLVGKNKPIRLAIERNQIHSMIFWGPPGSGKTTLARIIANAIKAEFHHLSAVSAGKSDVRKIVDTIKQHKNPQQLIRLNQLSHPLKSVVLFLDEIHRFNKAQQDYLLPYVEDGTIILIGATTENPSFEVISPLLSRCQVFVLEELSQQDLKKIIKRALSHLPARNASHSNAGGSISISKEAESFLISFANGDARQALNLLEVTTNLYGMKRSDLSIPGGRTSTKEITIDHLKSALQSKFLRYDRAGEEHYNVISAFIKSMRASNVDAAMYYLARMVDSGEDPLFIARRMVIFASEDIGMAQPTALVVANEVFRACDTIGYPECAINLAHGVAYLCKAPKDRSSYEALGRAMADVKQHGNLPVPLNLRNAPTKLMKELGYGKGYEKYPDQDKNLLPNQLKGRKYYQK